MIKKPLRNTTFWLFFYSNVYITVVTLLYFCIDYSNVHYSSVHYSSSSFLTTAL